MRLPALLLAALAATAAAATLAPASPTDANPTCDVCRWAWQSAQDALADPDTQQAVLKVVEDTACGAVPGAGADQCKQLAREYVPSAIAALESFTPGEACSTAGLCPPEAGLMMAAASTPHRVGCGGAHTARLRGLSCPMCRLTLNNIKLQLEDPANQADLVTKARTVRERKGIGGGKERRAHERNRCLDAKPTRLPTPFSPQVCAAMPTDAGATCNDWVDANSEPFCVCWVVPGSLAAATGRAFC